MTEFTRTDSPGDFVAAVPALLGFVPRNDIVLLLCGADKVVHSTLRLASDSDFGCVEVVAATVDASAETFAAVVIDPDPTAALAFLVGLLVQTKRPMFASISAPYIAEGAPFRETFSDVEGTQPDYRTTNAALGLTLEGRVIHAKREAIDELYAPWTPATLAPPLLTVEDTKKALKKLAKSTNKSKSISASLVGSLIIGSPKTRRQVLEIISSNPVRAHDVFATAARFLRGRVRVEALAFAAAAAYEARCVHYVERAIAAADTTAALLVPQYESPMLAFLRELYLMGARPEEIAEALAEWSA